MITEKRTQQSFQTCDTWKKAEDLIRSAKLENYTLTQVSYGMGIFHLLFEKGTGWGDQVIFTSKEFPDGSKITDYQAKGYAVTGMCAYPIPAEYTSVWITIMTQQSGLKEQKMFVTSEFPEKRIEASIAEGYKPTSLAYGNDYWILIVSKGVTQEVAWFSTSELNSAFVKSIKEQKLVITDLVYGANRWVAFCIKEPRITIQEIEKSDYYPEDSIREYWKNSFDIAWINYGQSSWISSYITYKSESTLAQEMMHRAIQERAQAVEQFMKAYQQGEFLQAAQIFEQRLAKLNPSEEELYHYLWALWQHPNTKEKIWDTLKQYMPITQSPRFNLLKGHYAAWKKWYDLALTYYENTSQDDYLKIKQLFQQYKSAFERQNYDEVVKQYQELFKDSLSEKLAWVGEYYAWALYQTTRDAFAAVDQINKMKEKVPGYKGWATVTGQIYKDVGIATKNLQILDMAIQFYQEDPQQNQSHIEEIKSKKIEIEHAQSTSSSSNPPVNR
ncbi:MAG: hypothetical protein NZ455_15995 [Bacteroidia bacterium]|nr:hypothetical protein [Bacteroidia bacterium]MDW8348172.1 hypothetical protein [Bacteroidia bacterium]